MGVPSLPDTAGNVLLKVPWLDVLISDACSGFNFFALIVSIYTALVFHLHGNGRILTRVVHAVPALYLLAVATNAARIVCCVYLRSVVDGLVSALLLDVLHYAVGISLFLSVLVATALYFQRRMSYGPRTA